MSDYVCDWIICTYGSLIDLWSTESKSYSSSSSSSSSSTWNDSLLVRISGREGRFFSFFSSGLLSLVVSAGFSAFLDLNTMRWLKSAGFSVSSVNQLPYQTMRICFGFTANSQFLYARQKYLLITRACKHKFRLHFNSVV